MQAALIQATVETYKADPAMLARARVSIAQGAKASGVDLNAMTLTDEGFRPTQKTGAADPAPTTAPTALAANDTPARAAPAGDPPYLMIAAAGGAGLGGAFLLGRMMRRG